MFAVLSGSSAKRAVENVRLFQNSCLYPSYAARLRLVMRGATDFEAMRARFLSDRFGACHFLLPVLSGDSSAFFTNGDDPLMQRAWATEHGMPARSTLEEILLAQIEQHRAEVFYNLDPVRYGKEFLCRLPGVVRERFAWRAAPSAGMDLSGYDLLLCNFPSILAGYRRQGLAAAWFAPAHDPVMDAHANSTDRPVDVLFVGGYSRHHRRRAEVLELVASRLAGRTVRFHLDRSRLTRLAESPAGRFLPLGGHRRPEEIRRCSAEPVFGLGLYESIGRSKIVLNGAVDMAGSDRGNMRCFEAMGCGAALVSDEGTYPPGMRSGETLATYSSGLEAARLIEELLSDPPGLARLAARGMAMIRAEYSKQRQWARFIALVSGERADPPGVINP